MKTIRGMLFFRTNRDLCQFSDSGRKWVWRCSVIQFETNFLQQTLKYGSISVMVEGAIWNCKRSSPMFRECTINAHKYIQIPKEGFSPIFQGSKFQSTRLHFHGKCCTVFTELKNRLPGNLKMGLQFSVAGSVT